jgi:pimeloyl-ACP methyl ester carboxylesterase
VTPRLASYLGLSLDGFHRLAYWQWGPAEAELTLVCVHGLTRQARDFDVLARTFARRGWRVICPDLVGRGQSAWLAQPAGYTPLQYGEPAIQGQAWQWWRRFAWFVRPRDRAVPR